METKDEEVIHRSYDDFEPFCQWIRQEGHDKLEVHLRDFKKEHLWIKIDESGVMTIAGERPLDDTRCSRFLKQVKIAGGSNIKEIRADISGGILKVRVPRKTSAITSSMPSNYLLRTGSSISRLKINTMLTLQAAVVLAAVVAFGAYAYKYCRRAHAEN